MAKENTNALKSKSYYNELVEVELFKDTDKYKDDVFVAVNGVGMIVPRGEKVKIPRKFAIALENARTQENFAIKTMQKLSEGAKTPELNQ